MGKRKEKSPSSVSFGKIFAWGTRPIALGATAIIVGYLSLYCTDVLHMNPGLVGVLLMASKVFDGVTDLVAGWIVDNTKTKWGKGRPYELCLIGVWGCMWALFAASPDWSIVAKSIWLVIMYTLVFSIFSTMLNAAENPYIIRAFKDPVAITKVASYSGIIITLGCMIVSISFPMAIAGADGASGWRKIMAVYAVVLTVIGLIRFVFVKEKDDEAGSADVRVSVKDILQVLKSNKYVWLLGIATCIPTLITSLAAGSYYFTWIVGDMGKYGTMQMFGMISMVTMLIFPSLMKRYSGMQMIKVFSIIGIAGYILNFFAGGNMILLAIGFIISGLASLPGSYMRTPIIMQLSDYNEGKGLPRMEGTLGSAVNFMQKIAQGIGSLLCGVFLSIGGYSGALEAQSGTAIFMIKCLYGLIPAAFLVVAVICACKFKPLDEETFKKSV